MSFRINRFFYLITSLAIGIFFLILGIFATVIPWSPKMKEVTAHFFLENTLILFLFGLGFLLIGLSLLIYTFINSRHRYIHIRTGSHALLIDEAVVQHYLKTYWKQHFPDGHIPFQIFVKKNSLQITAELPSMPLPDQKKFLEQVREDFSDIFGNILGYPHDVNLFASFKTNNSQ